MVTTANVLPRKQALVLALGALPNLRRYSLNPMFSTTFNWNKDIVNHELQDAL
jgi:hypothetical protein